MATKIQNPHIYVGPKSLMDVPATWWFSSEYAKHNFMTEALFLSQMKKLTYALERVNVAASSITTTLDHLTIT